MTEFKNDEELQYLNLINNILENGTWENGRNGKTKWSIPTIKYL